MTPEPCLAGQCPSPMACGDWQYCRERNIRESRTINATMQEKFRRAAARRKAEAEKEGK